MRDRESQRHRQREKQTPDREPDGDSILRLRITPEPGAGTQLLSHPGVPSQYFFFKILFVHERQRESET